MARSFQGGADSLRAFHDAFPQLGGVLLSDVAHEQQGFKRQDGGDGRSFQSLILSTEAGEFVGGSEWSAALPVGQCASAMCEGLPEIRPSQVVYEALKVIGHGRDSFAAWRIISARLATISASIPRAALCAQSVVGGGLPP